MTTIVDVRSPGEFAAGHVEGALNIPVELVMQGELGALAGVPQDTPVYLYCRSGARAKFAQMALEAAGYTKVENWGSLEAARENAAKLG